jgi:hypothetical protein
MRFGIPIMSYRRYDIIRKRICVPVWAGFKTHFLIQRNRVSSRTRTLWRPNLSRTYPRLREERDRADGTAAGTAFLLSPMQRATSDTLIFRLPRVEEKNEEKKRR